MGNQFHLGDWLIEPDLNQISKAGRTLSLEPKAMDLLVFLARHRGEVLSRDMILREVWQGTHVSAEALTYTVSELRKSLGDHAKDPQIIQTIPRRGYRLIAEVRETEPTAPSPLAAPALKPGRRAHRGLFVAGAAIVFGAVTVFFTLWHLRSSPVLTATDCIILIDFQNTTGDPVFDDTLQQALAIHLQQSPFLNVFPEERARETLQYMGRPHSEPLTRDVCREICQRRGIRAMLAGSIAGLGQSYVISLEVINPLTGDVLARQQEEAASKEEVLRSLGKGVTDLRQRLGESLASVGRFDVPLEQATTSSLEAFKAYSLGRRKLVGGKWAEGVPHYLRALQLDPRFASAYDDLAWCYISLLERELAADAARKAYSLRDKVSEYERLSICAIYHTLASGDIDKAIESLEVMREVYPRSAPVHNTLGGRYANAGRFQEAIACFEEAIRLNQHPNAYGGLANTLLGMNRLADAKKTIAEARSLGIDNQDLRSARYLIAFLEGDRAVMKEEADGARNSADEFQMRGLQAAAAAVQGRVQEFRLYSRQAVDAARLSGMTQAAVGLAAEGARAEALLGSPDSARQVLKGVETAGSWPELLRNSITLLLCRDISAAEKLVDEQERRYGGIDQVRAANVPALRAIIAMEKGYRAGALQLRRALERERSRIPSWLVYMLGEALLRHGEAREAATEFAAVLNRSNDRLEPFQPLARLGIARAARMSGDTEKSRKAYNEFLTLWRHADQDLPLLRQARAEISKLEAHRAAP